MAETTKTPQHRRARPEAAKARGALLSKSGGVALSNAECGVSQEGNPRSWPGEG
jgi:hypothetical protein